MKRPLPKTSPGDERQVIRVKGNKPVKTGMGKPAECTGAAPGAKAAYRSAMGGMSPRR